MLIGLAFLFINNNKSLLKAQIRSRLMLGEAVVPPVNAESHEGQYLARLSRKLKLTNETEWMSWKVHHSEQSSEWATINNIQVNFGSHGSRVVDVEQPNVSDLSAKGRMELPIPKGRPTDKPLRASDFVFGVSTTYSRVMEKDKAIVKSWQRWLTNGGKRSNGASLVVMLDRANDAQVKEIERILLTAKIEAQVMGTKEALSAARRYFELTKLLKSSGAIFAASGENKKWFSLVEDDIFFPDMAYLQNRLSAYKDSNQLYIGLPSERQDWESEGNTITTYGGGAVFLTRAALFRIHELPCFSTRPTKSPYRARKWDVLLHDCVMTHTDMKMFVLPGFFSPDDSQANLHADSYESGVRPLLFHNNPQRHWLDLNKAHLVTDVCGETCFMQRYVFRDNWVLVNGVSLSHHPEEPKYDQGHGGDEAAPQKQKHISRFTMPRQIMVDDGGVDRTTMAWAGNRKVWRLMDSVVSQDGAVWQAYVKKAVKDASASESDKIDSVVVLVWEKSA